MAKRETANDLPAKYTDIGAALAIFHIGAEFGDRSADRLWYRETGFPTIPHLLI